MIKVVLTLDDGSIETFFVKDYKCCGVGPPGIHFFFAEDKERFYDQRKIKGIIYTEDYGLF